MMACDGVGHLIDLTPGHYSAIGKGLWLRFVALILRTVDLVTAGAVGVLLQDHPSVAVDHLLLLGVNQCESVPF